MVAIKPSVNVFALLDGDDPGDKRLADFDPQHKDQPKKQPTVSAAACDYKLKLVKPPAPAASGSKAPRKNPTPAAGRRSMAAASTTARAVNNKQTTAAPAVPPARSINYTAALFAKAYPSARERIFKQRQEEFELRQAKAAENGGGVTGNDGKNTAAGAPSAGYGKGKTHGARVQQAGGDGAKQQPGAMVKEAPPATAVKAARSPAAEEPKAAPVVQTLLPPPSIDDIVQFPSLN